MLGIIYRKQSDELYPDSSAGARRARLCKQRAGCVPRFHNDTLWKLR